MFRNLFRPDSPLMVTMSQITDCIFLSLFWLLGCFPVVTAAASTAAMYDAVYRGFRQGDKNSWQRFFGSFRQNLKPGLVPSVVLAAAAAALGWGAVQLWNNAVYGTISWAVFAGGGFVLLVPVGILSLMGPMLSRFENPTARLLGNCVRLGLGNLPRILGLAFLNVVSVFLCIRFIFPVFFLPALAALIGTLFIEPVFRPYMPVEEDAA